MCGFITSGKLDKQLRAKDWSGFAFHYNGTDFQKKKYDEKLAVARCSVPSVWLCPAFACGGIAN